MNTTTTSTGYLHLNSEKKKQILERLIKDGHINVDELLILMQNDKEYVYIPTIDSPVVTQLYSSPVVGTTTTCCGIPSGCTRSSCPAGYVKR